MTKANNTNTPNELKAGDIVITANSYGNLFV